MIDLKTFLILFSEKKWSYVAVVTGGVKIIIRHILVIFKNVYDCRDTMFLRISIFGFSMFSRSSTPLVDENSEISLREFILQN